MVKILDRYLVREILLPFALVLIGLTFALEMPPILQQGEKLIEKGVQWHIVAQVLLTLLPQALGITIPMSLLLGILVGFGRLSADREFVALQACGVSVFRILRPLGVFALVCTGATAYVMIVALPNANQRFREITFNVVASQAEGDVKPRVFYDAFPNQVLYVRDIPQSGGWRDVFLADSTHADETHVYFARRGRLLIDRAKRTVQLDLEDGTQHTTYAAEPDKADVSSFERLLLKMDAEAVFPRIQVIKGDNEKTIAELRATIAENTARGLPWHGQLFTIQQKFAIPAACLVLAMIGLGLGVTNRKEGKLAGFVLGIGVLFVYYVLLFASRGLALGGRISPTLAPWIANVLLGIAGVALVMWRAGSGDQPIRIRLIALEIAWRLERQLTFGERLVLNRRSHGVPLPGRRELSVPPLVSDPRVRRQAVGACATLERHVLGVGEAVEAPRDRIGLEHREPREPIRPRVEELVVIDVAAAAENPAPAGAEGLHRPTAYRSFEAPRVLVPVGEHELLQREQDAAEEQPEEEHRHRRTVQADAARAHHDELAVLRQ